jgi:hypothetical protein
MILLGGVVLAGCSHFGGGTGTGSAVSYGSGSRIELIPLRATGERTVDTVPSSPFPAGDTEQSGPPSELEGNRNWGHDIMPVGPGLRHIKDQVYKL